MLNVEEARKKFFEAKKMVELCRASIVELQVKADQLQDSLPKLSGAVEDAEKAKTAALDNFALTSSKITESILKAARGAHEAAQKAYSESNELIEACSRSLKKQESEFARLNNACELTRRQVWESVFDEIKNNIPAHIFDAVRTLLVAGAQCSQTRQFMLDSLFPNIPTDEFQEIRRELAEKHDLE